MIAGVESSGSPQPEPGTADDSPPTDHPNLTQVTALAKKLDPGDQMRLIARLLASLPSDHRAAAVEFGLQLQTSIDNRSTHAHLSIGNLVSAKLWERLFDPAGTSGLYSAPRRFDLATIFVVTAAYSILFGAMSALNYYFGPLTKVAVGILVTVVAVAQAFYKDSANPRGVSVLTGAITQTMIMLLIEIFAPRLFPEPALLVVIVYGMLGGAVSGYLAGVLVGGVFLVADALRKRYTRGAHQLEEDGSTANPVLAERGDSPWTN
jgi:hypothetical protein